MGTGKLIVCVAVFCAARNSIIEMLREVESFAADEDLLTECTVKQTALQKCTHIHRSPPSWMGGGISQGQGTPVANQHLKEGYRCP